MNTKLTEEDCLNILSCIRTTTDLVSVEGEFAESLSKTDDKIHKILSNLQKKKKS